MKRPTDLARIIDLVADKVRYDACTKRLLTYSAITVWILKCCVREFFQYSVPFIAEHCLKGSPKGRYTSTSQIKRRWMWTKEFKGILRRPIP